MAERGHESLYLESSLITIYQHSKCSHTRFLYIQDLKEKSFTILLRTTNENQWIEGSDISRL